MATQPFNIIAILTSVCQKELCKLGKLLINIFCLKILV